MQTAVGHIETQKLVWLASTALDRAELNKSTVTRFHFAIPLRAHEALARSKLCWKTHASGSILKPNVQRLKWRNAILKKKNLPRRANARFFRIFKRYFGLSGIHGNGIRHKITKITFAVIISCHRRNERKLLSAKISAKKIPAAIPGKKQSKINIGQ